MDRVNENRALSDREIAEGKTEVASMPRRLIATLSTKCNSRCIMCEVRHARWDIPGRTLEEIQALFPYLESVAWQGGEVFFLDFFPALFAEALRFPALRQTIVSNGQLLDERWAEKLAGANMELALSIDGATAEIYEKIRSGSRYDVLLRNIRMLNEARAKAGARLSLRMHTVVMRSNCRQIELFPELAKENGFDALHMMPIWGGQEISENIFLPGNEALLEEVRGRITRAQRRAGELGIEFLSSLPLGGPGRERPAAPAPAEAKAPAAADGRREGMLCYLPWQQLNIDPGGGARPGCLCSRSLGSLEEKPLRELWNGEAMQRYRKAVLAGGKGWCNEQCVNGALPMSLRRV